MAPANHEERISSRVFGRQKARDQGRVRLLASVPNFEEAFFGEAADGDKPFSALVRLKKDELAYGRIGALLDARVDSQVVVPDGAIAWTSIEQLKMAVAADISAVVEGSAFPVGAQQQVQLTPTTVTA